MDELFASNWMLAFNLDVNMDVVPVEGKYVTIVATRLILRDGIVIIITTTTIAVVVVDSIGHLQIKCEHKKKGIDTTTALRRGTIIILVQRVIPNEIVKMEMRKWTDQTRILGFEKTRVILVGL